MEKIISLVSPNAVTVIMQIDKKLADYLLNQFWSEHFFKICLKIVILG